MINLKSLKNRRVLITYISGILLLLILLKDLYFGVFIIKYDYITQHIPFYEEFYRLLSEGLPLWSWNGFLGLNFYASKTYYLIGDLYAWLGALTHMFYDDVPMILSYLTALKILVSYSTFFILSKYWNIEYKYRLLLSLVYALSGWQIMFLEQPMFASFYSFVPLLLLGLEVYFDNKKSLILIFSVSLLVSTNFYLFWMLSWLFLFYFIYRYVQIKSFKLEVFFQTSLQMISYFVIGVLLVSYIWLPGVLHLIQSGRVGTFLDTFTNWSSLQVHSLITYTLVPNLRYDDGIFKDYFYYFNQVSIYTNTLFLLIIFQLFSRKIEARSRLLNLVAISVMILLLISPNIGLFFNFSYSLRYTLIHTIFILFLSSQALSNIKKWSIKSAFIGQFIVSIAFLYLLNFAIPNAYPTLPTQTLEIGLLKWGLFLSFIYTLIIIIWIYNIKISILPSILVLISIMEWYQFSTANLKSIEGSGEVYAFDQNFIDALEYIYSQDSSFYRIYTNTYPNYYNLSYSYDFMSIKSHDTMYQYSLQNFLHLAREYPYIHWGFDLHEFSILQNIALKYEILENAELLYPNGIYQATQLEQTFGPYTIYRYDYETGFAKTYTTYRNIEDLLKLNIESEDYYVYKVMDAFSQDVYLDTDSVDLSTLSNIKTTHQYFNPILLKNNFLEINIELSENSLIVFNMPYDQGWTIVDHTTSVDSFSVQGGLMGIQLDEGVHYIKMKFIPNGLILGMTLSVSCFILLLILIFKKII